jgi:Fur family ferric uptake transcriptional regulator
LEKSLGEEFDRVTLYRTLTSFLGKGLIHKVPDDEGAARYAVCLHAATTQAHHDQHIHFKCNVCGTTHCLDELPFPNFKEPEGYVFKETNVLIQGICKNCAKA